MSRIGFTIIIFWGLLSLRTQAQFAPLPYYITVEPVTGMLAQQGVHSFAFAQEGSRWLIVGGRTNGLHGMNSNDAFLDQHANNELIVIDTLSWIIYSSNLNQLGKALADPLRSSNMQYFQDGQYLFMIGGYGKDSLQNKLVTFPTLTSIRVDSIIEAVIAGQPILPFVKQLVDTNLRVCGAELQKLGNDFYLAFGHDFNGRYTQQASPLFTQVYSNRIRKFQIQSNNGTGPTISNYVEITDTINFHRRDLNLIPIVKPNGSFGLIATGGVFKKDHDFPYQEPISIDASGFTVQSYQQLMSQYTCANVPIYDSVIRSMYITYLGGISFYTYDHFTSTLLQDTLSPFVDDISSLIIDQAGNMQESISNFMLPGLLGSNAKFVLKSNVPHYSNDVINWNGLSSSFHIGYMLGGIRSDVPNNPPFSVANDTIYRVYLVKQSVGFNEKNESGLHMSLFPNPSTSGSDFSIIINGFNETNNRSKLIIYNTLGQCLFTEEIVQSFPWKKQISGLGSGVYFVNLETLDHINVIRKLIIQ